MASWKEPPRGWEVGGAAVLTVMLAAWHMLCGLMSSAIAGAKSRSREEGSVAMWQGAGKGGHGDRNRGEVLCQQFMLPKRGWSATLWGKGRF